MACSITIRDVRKTYGQFVALDSVALDIAPGEFLTLLGPSGSGKTTLLMILAGFIRPEAGSITVDSDEILRKPPHLRNIGMVFQNYALFPHMSVGENVGYPLKLRKVGAAERYERAREALKLVQLDHLMDRRINQLSGGQRQRVALARAIVFEPQILLMDEPLSALDKKLREQMQIELKHLHDRLGMTTVYVTHDQREALTMSDRVAVMNHGHILQVAPPREIYERPCDRFVADFVGESNFLPVEMRGDAATFGGAPLQLAEGQSAGSGNKALLVRPEKLDILGATPAPEHNPIDGTVEELVYQGETMLIYVTLTSGETIALRRGTRQQALSEMPRVGEPIRLGLHRDDTVLIDEAAHA
ncbi:ABC transporter ATP-binding protein [Stappia stellulata]|uniref:ABC transporter ATP-binding protein n=1 Tax=Stappia stellulata TaxID=71235 RepID=UPI000410D509|nr:ABC transporter ATP-binding protein [Stappia stellulata]